MANIDRMLTENPWNALFDNLPGIAQQVNQAMMQRKQQQLDQQNIERQFVMKSKEMAFRGAQFQEGKRQADRQFQIETGRVLSEGKPPDDRADIWSTLLPQVAPELQSQKQEYLDELALFEGGNIGLGMRSKYPGIRQAAESLYRFEASEEQRGFAKEEAARKSIEMTMSLIETGILTEAEGKERIRAAGKYGVFPTQAAIDVDTIEAGGDETKVAGWSWSKYITDAYRKRQAEAKAKREARKKK